MALRNIFVEGDDILAKKCKPVEEVNDKIRLQLDDMLETMRESQGVGIAAPQVGLLKRMCIIEPDAETVYELINPEIVVFFKFQKSCAPARLIEIGRASCRERV